MNWIGDPSCKRRSSDEVVVTSGWRINSVLAGKGTDTTLPQEFSCKDSRN